MKRSRTRTGAAVALGVILAVFGGASAASAGPTGVDPGGCGTGATIRFVDFQVDGATMREELRYASGCDRVGWGRLTRVKGTNARPLALVQTAWNPGGPSQGQVPYTNWTYTVDASPGRQVCAGFQAYWVDSLGGWHHIGWFSAGCYTAA